MLLQIQLVRLLGGFGTLEPAYKIFIEDREDVKNNAGQIMHNHAGEVICNRTAFKHGGGWVRRKTGQRWWLHSDTQHSSSYITVSGGL